MVRQDEVLDLGGQVVALCQFDALADVADDDLCRFDARHLLQGIDTGLVFGEEDGVLHLSDVVIERAGTHQLRVGTDAVGDGRGKVAHHDGVLEGSGSFFRQLAHQVFRSVRQFDERHVGGEAEHLLDTPHQGVGKEQEHAVDGQVFVHRVVHSHDAVVLHQLHGKIDGARHDGDEQGGLEQLGTVGQLAQRVDGHHAGHELYDDELVLVFHGGGADHHHDHVGHEGCPGVEEDAYEDGCDGQGQYVDAEEAVAHHERDDDGEDGDERVDHQQRARVLEIVGAEQDEVDGEQRYEDEHEDGLSGDGRRYLVGGCTASLRLAFERAEHAVEMVVDDLAAVDNLLPREHHARSDGDGAEQVGLLRLAALFVVDKIGHDILVEVALLQLLPLGCKTFVHEELLVGSNGRVDAVDLDIRGALAAHDAHHVGRVFEDFRIFCRRHDTRLIEPMQTVGDDADVAVGQSGNAVAVLLAEARYLLRLHLGVVVVVRLEGVHDAVFLGLEGFVGLIDRKVELGDERTVHPRFRNVVAQLRPIVARQRPYDEDDRDDDDGQTGHHVAPIIVAWNTYLAHTFCRLAG